MFTKKFKGKKKSIIVMYYKNTEVINTASSHILFLLVTMVCFNGSNTCARCTQSSVIRIHFQPLHTVLMPLEHKHTPRCLQ